MTQPHAPHSHDAHAEAHAHAGPHHPASFYVKIWAVLVVLLGISVAGPEIGIFWVTMVTAFGIALVKAYLVAAHFMHLNIEKKLATRIIVAALVLMAVFFGGVAPDIMKHEGDQWVNAAAKAETARRFEKEGHHGPRDEGGREHGAPAHGAAPEHGAPAHGAAPAPAH